MPVLTDVLADRIDKLVDKLEVTNTGLAVLTSRVDRSLRDAKWALGLLTLVVLACAPAVLGIYRDVALLNQSVGELKSAVGRIEAKVDRLGQLEQPIKAESPKR